MTQATRIHADLVGLLRGVREGTPQVSGNLTVVPLFGPLSGPALVGLAEAVLAGQVEITEASEGGTVNEIRIRNLGDSPVFIVEGDELRGAKQNRITNTSLLVSPRTEVRVPASCIEAGRWRYREKGFHTTGRSSHYSMRASKTTSVNQSLRRTGSYVGNQSKVWTEVTRYLTEREVCSDTSCLSDAYDRDGGTIEERIGAIRPEADQVGLAVYVNGHFAGMDLVGRPEVYARLHDRFVRAGAAEAISRTRERVHARRATAPAILRRLEGSTEGRFASPGVGVDVRLEARGLVGTALVVEGEVVHLTTFPAPLDGGRS